MAVFSEKVAAPLTCRAPSSRAAAATTIRELEEAIHRLGPGSILAFVCESVGGQASGANVADPLFFAEARRICTEHGIKVVFDEIVSAFGTGRFLAAHHHPSVLPDLVVMAKGLGPASPHSERCWLRPSWWTIWPTPPAFMSPAPPTPSR
jgi:adenosylmethionine-8-amino-7-oxononanoate aminotransferase